MDEENKKSEEKKSIWDREGLETFERFDKLNADLKEIDSFVEVVAVDDGREVSADILKQAYKAKGIKQIAKDAIVILFEVDGNKKEFWLNATSYTNLRELKEIRGDKTLPEAGKIKITRVAVNDPNQANYKFEKA